MDQNGPLRLELVVNFDRRDVAAARAVNSALKDAGFEVVYASLLSAGDLSVLQVQLLAHLGDKRNVFHCHAVSLELVFAMLADLTND